MIDKFFFKSWKPWQAGVAIGLLAIFAYLSSDASGRNYPLGTTHGVLHAKTLIIDKDFNHVLHKSLNIKDNSNTINSSPINSDKSNIATPKKKKNCLVACIIGY